MLRDGRCAPPQAPAQLPLDAGARAADSACRMVQAHTARLPLIFGVATILGLFSGFQAVQFVALFSERDTSVFTLLALNLS
jgi:hypothetical protein